MTGIVGKVAYKEGKQEDECIELTSERRDKERRVDAFNSLSGHVRALRPPPP
jgi:hypothetical protein